MTWRSLGLGLMCVLVACAARRATEPRVSLDARPQPGATVLVFESTVSPEAERAARTLVPVVQAAFECSEDFDCVVMELGCCTSCNGGRLLSVNHAYADSVGALLSERNCEERQCSDRACPDYGAVCDEGACARLEERQVNAVMTEVVVVHNEVPRLGAPPGGGL